MIDLLYLLTLELSPADSACCTARLYRSSLSETSPTAPPTLPDGDLGTEAELSLPADGFLGEGAGLFLGMGEGLGGVASSVSIDSGCANDWIKTRSKFIEVIV